jgi:HEAT repeat protein
LRREGWVAIGLVAAAIGCAPRTVSTAEPPAAVSVAHSDTNPPAAKDLDRYRELLDDPDPGMRIAAARLLVEHGDLKGKAILLGALRSPDAHHRIDAALALQKLKDPETIAELRRAAQVERHPLARTVLKETLKQVLRDH